jgi:protein O-mannosyl-transferase
MKSQKTKSNQNSKSNRPWFPVVLLISIVFLYYGNTVKNGYSLDDDLVTTTDNSVHERVEKGISGIPEIFMTHYVQSDRQKYEYRPIVTTSFAIENQFVGEKSIQKRASISHLINVMLYALLIVLIYLLIFKLFPDKNWVFPFVVALLFLIHPVHSEVVNNIKCRDELFVMIFGLLGVFSFLKYVDSDYKKLIHLVLGILMLMLSILSKKVGITFIVLIPLTLYFFRDLKIKKFVVLFSLMLIGFLVFFLLKKIAVSDGVVREVMFFENPLYFAESNLERVPMFFYSIMYYLKMMIFPVPLVYYYGYDQIEIVGWSNPFVWVGVVFVFSGVFFAFKRIKKKEMWVFGFLFFMFGVGGGANLLFPAVGIVAERFVFTGSFGLIFLAVYYGFELYEKKKLSKHKFAYCSIGGLLLILSFSQVTDRNKHWSSRLSLYKNDIKNLPNSAKAHSLLGTEYKAKADLMFSASSSSFTSYVAYVDSSARYIDSAILEFEKCTEIYPEYHNASNNAGALYFSKKKNHYKAKPLFLEAIKYRPTYVEALFNYGNCFSNDLKGVRELQRVLKKKNAVDTIAPLNAAEKRGFEQEIKAGFAILMIKNEVRQSLNNVNLKNPNWRDLLKYQIMLSFKTHFEVEEGIMLREFNVAEFEVFLLRSIQNVSQGNVQDKLQELMYYVENSLEQVIVNYVFGQIQTDREYLNKIHFDLIKQAEFLFSTSELNWYKALDVDPTYSYSYKKLVDLYLVEERYDKILSVSAKAIKEGGFENNSEFYLNIGNVYNSKKDYPNAIKNMKIALEEIDKAYADVYAKDSADPIRRQKQLLGLLNQKKQIYNFIANIYYTSEDMNNAAYYQGLVKNM